jgi:hypothetical protein
MSNGQKSNFSEHLLGTLYAQSKISLKIFLDITSYDCLREHLSSELMLRSCLSAAVMLGNTRVVDCDETQARELLVIARNHCPGAVRKINEAMLMAGLTL